MKKLVSFALGLAVSFGAHANQNTPLNLDVYNAGQGSFHVNSTLLTGDKEALLIDTGFTKSDALQIAAKVLDSGKNLTTIFISQADPDYYFGAEFLHTLFPDANIVTTPAVQKAIKAKLQNKLDFWGPKLGSNAPVSPFIPKLITDNTLTLEGHTIEIHGTQGALANRPYLWIPSNKAILGNIAIFGNLHVWTADTQSDDKISAWNKQLTHILSLDPEIVVPGHMKAGTALNTETIVYTQEYLRDFIEAKAGSKNSAELIEKMQQKYPNAQLPIALDIGAKVHMGEMPW
ncbi:MBL fold metallo-hydrolase [Marinomonas epiphytica]